MKYLIEEQNTDPSCHDENKTTPLHIAAVNGRLDIVKYLTLDENCNPLDRELPWQPLLSMSLLLCGHLRRSGFLCVTVKLLIPILQVGTVRLPFTMLLKEAG